MHPQSPPPGNRGVRADVQSLRALAVGLVVVNHLWPGDLAGGYIGVDIFFVISGYLITSHLLREVDATGTVKLGRFWARRAKRLLPAAIVVLAASAVIAYWLLPVTSVRSALGEIGAAGAYVLNWLLAANSLDYFAHDGVSPVTHFWSLSVEEQFYLVWPALILLGLFLGRSRSRRFRHVMMIGTLAVVFTASLAWALWSVANQPNAAYFQTFGRAWEFAAGGLLAFMPAVWSTRRLSEAPRAMLSWALWAAIVVCAFVYGPTTGFPGLPALLPVIASAALIAIGDGGARFSPQRLFAIRPVQFVGDISYSLYLWHWPLIVAVMAIIGDLSGVMKGGIILATVALAWLTKRYVEDPVRTAQGPLLGKPWRVLVATAATVALIFGGTTAAAATITSRAEVAAAELYAQSVDPAECFGAQAAFNDGCDESRTLLNADYTLPDWGVQEASVSNGNACQQQRGQAEVLSCSFGVPEGEESVDVALVGDSHATVWASALDGVALRDDARVTTFLAAGCAVLDDPSITFAFDPIHKNIDACRQWRANVITTLAESTEIDAIVTTSVDRFYSKETDPSEKDSGDGYVKAWTQWLEAGKIVVVINSVPIYREDVPACLAEESTKTDPCTMTINPDTRNGPLAVAAEQIDHANFHFVDHWDVFCDGATCSPVIGGIPAYIDLDHITASFARSFGDDFIPEGLLLSSAG